MSGTITPPNLSAGATVTLKARYSGTIVATTTVAANGDYTFPKVNRGRYRIIPQKTEVQFSPKSRGIHVYRSPIAGMDFTASSVTATTYSIAGTITGGAGSTVALSGPFTSTSTADASGNFTFSGLANGTYTITPSKTGYTFSPTTRSVTVNGSNVSGITFAATATPPTTFSISGAISPTANGAGSTLSLSGASSASTSADANGNYTFTGLANGSYTVTPSKSGFSFSPTSASVSVNGNNVSGTDFSATAVSNSHSVDLNWTGSTSTGVSGYKVYRSTTTGGPYAVVTSAPVTSTVYTDLSVTSGTTYYYVVTAVDSAGNESAFSNQATAVVPTP